MAGQNNQNSPSSNTNNGTSGSSGSSGGSNSGTPSRGKVSGGVDRDGNLTGTYKAGPVEIKFNPQKGEYGIGLKYANKGVGVSFNTQELGAEVNANLGVVGGNLGVSKKYGLNAGGNIVGVGGGVTFDRGANLGAIATAAGQNVRATTIDVKYQMNGTQNITHKIPVREVNLEANSKYNAKLTFMKIPERTEDIPGVRHTYFGGYLRTTEVTIDGKTYAKSELTPDKGQYKSIDDFTKKNIEQSIKEAWAMANNPKDRTEQELPDINGKPLFGIKESQLEKLSEYPFAPKNPDYIGHPDRHKMSRFEQDFPANNPKLRDKIEPYSSNWQPALHKNFDKLNQLHQPYDSQQEMQGAIQTALNLRKEIHAHEQGKGTPAYKAEVLKDQQRMTHILEQGDGQKLNYSLRLIHGEYAATFGDEKLKNRLERTETPLAPESFATNETQTNQTNSQASNDIQAGNTPSTDAKAPIETAALTTPTNANSASTQPVETNTQASLQPLAASVGGQARTGASSQEEKPEQAKVEKPAFNYDNPLASATPEQLALMQRLFALHEKEAKEMERLEQYKLVKENREKGLPDNTSASQANQLASKEGLKDAPKAGDKSSPQQASNDATVNDVSKETNVQAADNNQPLSRREIYEAGFKKAEIAHQEYAATHVQGQGQVRTL